MTPLPSEQGNGLLHIEAGIPEGGGRAAGGYQQEAGGVEGRGQVDEALLIGDG